MNKCKTIREITGVFILGCKYAIQKRKEKRI